MYRFDNTQRVPENNTTNSVDPVVTGVNNQLLVSSFRQNCLPKCTRNLLVERVYDAAGRGFEYSILF